MIGSALIPELAVSRGAYLMAFLAGIASVLLGVLPIELWMLPLLVLVPQRARGLAIASLAGVAGALLALFHAGGHVGDSGVVPFLLETSGAVGIAAFQQAHEDLGVAYAVMLGVVGPSARDAALMFGQRGLAFVPFAAGVLLHAVVRGALLVAAASLLARGNNARLYCRHYTLAWWVALGSLSLLLA